MEYFFFSYREIDETDLSIENQELKTPRFLTSDANLPVAHLKKLIISKYGIDTAQFYVSLFFYSP